MNWGLAQEVLESHKFGRGRIQSKEGIVGLS